MNYTRKVFLLFIGNVAGLFLLSSFSAISRADAPQEKENSPILTQENLKQVQKSGTYKVVRVIDDLTLILDNDEVVRLVSLDIPDRHKQSPPKHVKQAFDLLKQEFEGKQITFYQSPDPDKGRANRMGHALGHIIRSKDKLWAQGILLKNGLARTRTTKDNAHLALAMYGQEEKARNEEQGIWAMPEYQVLDAKQAAQNKHGYEIVMGTIKSVAAVNNTIYLNFGQNWRTDFTIALPVDLRRDLLSEGLDPLKWQDKTLRARGWIEDYNGPYIKIDHIERLEFITREPKSSNDTEKQGKAYQPLPYDQRGHKLTMISFNNKA